MGSKKLVRTTVQTAVLLEQEIFLTKYDACRRVQNMFYRLPCWDGDDKIGLNGGFIVPFNRGFIGSIFNPKQRRQDRSAKAFWRFGLIELGELDEVVEVANVNLVQRR